MSRALTLAPPLTPLPNLDLTRSPSLDRPGSARQSKIDRRLGLRKEAGSAPANIMGGHAYPKRQRSTGRGRDRRRLRLLGAVLESPTRVGTKSA